MVTRLHHADAVGTVCTSVNWKMPSRPKPDCFMPQGLVADDLLRAIGPGIFEWQSDFLVAIAVHQWAHFRAFVHS